MINVANPSWDLVEAAVSKSGVGLEISTQIKVLNIIRKLRSIGVRPPIRIKAFQGFYELTWVIALGVSVRLNALRPSRILLRAQATSTSAAFELDDTPKSPRLFVQLSDFMVRHLSHTDLTT